MNRKSSFLIETVNSEPLDMQSKSIFGHPNMSNITITMETGQSHAVKTLICSNCLVSECDIISGIGMKMCQVDIDPKLGQCQRTNITRRWSNTGPTLYTQRQHTNHYPTLAQCKHAIREFIDVNPY